MPTLIRAEYLICDPDLREDGVIADGALVIDAGEIVAAGAWADLEPEYEHLTPLCEPESRLVVPGLINAHHHGRGLGTVAAGMPDAPLELWLPAFLQYATVDTYWNTRYAAAQMLRSGITASLQNHSATGPLEAYRESVVRALDAYQDAGVRISFAMGHLNQNMLANYISDEAFLQRLSPAIRAQTVDYFDVSNLYIDTEDYFALFEELQEAYARTKLLLSPIGIQWASDGLLARMAGAASDYGAGVHLHLLETQYQREYVRRRFGAPAVDVLADLSLLGPHVSLAHGIWLTEEELTLLADTDTTVVTNTSSNLRLGSGLLPLNALRAAGVDVALGLDSMSLLDNEDMLTEMSLVSSLHRAPGLDVDWPSIYDVLRMATVAGAKAAQLDGVVGKLLPGYRADITVLNLHRLRGPYVAPNIDEVALALRRARRDDIDTVLVDGDVLVQDGRLTKLDINTIEMAVAEYAGASSDADAARDALAGLVQELQQHTHDLYRNWSLDEYHSYEPRNSRV